MILFLCTELKKILVSEFFFKFNNYFFSTGTPTTNKLDDGIPVTHLYDFKYRTTLVVQYNTSRKHNFKHW